MGCVESIRPPEEDPNKVKAPEVTSSMMNSFKDAITEQAEEDEQTCKYSYQVFTFNLCFQIL